VKLTMIMSAKWHQ